MWKNIEEKWLLGLGIAAWLLVYGVLLPPPFGETDTYFFKDAGANLALGHGFVSVVTFGNPTFEPKLYAQYPPLHGLAFAAFSRVFGIGARQNALFNLSIAATACVVAYMLLRRVQTSGGFRLYRAILIGLTILAVPVAFSGIAGDRPDALGLAAAAAALLALSGGNSFREYFFAALVAGLALEISPVSGVLAGVGIGAFWISRWFESDRRQRWTSWRSVAAAACGFPIFPVLVTGILLAIDPTWLHRFLTVASGSTSAAAGNWAGGFLLALLHGDFRGFLAAYEFSQPDHAVYYTTLLAVVVAIIGHGIWSAVSTRRLRALAPHILIVAIACLPLLLFPYQSRYVGIDAGVILLLFATIVRPRDITGAKARQLAIIAGFGGMLIVNAPFFLRDRVYQAHLGSSLQRMTATLSRLKAQGIFQGKIIAVSPDLYMLYKQEGLDVVTWYSPYVADPAIRRHISFYALAYYGTHDPLRPWYPDWWQQGDYTLLFAPRLPQQVTALGLTSHSSITWEAAIYESR